jgi:hypothetical protein
VSHLTHNDCLESLRLMTVCSLVVLRNARQM